MQLVSESRFEADYEAIQRAFQLNPIPPASYYNVRGQILTSLKRFEKAEKAFGRCLELALQFVTCHRYLTAMYLKSGDLEAARRSAGELIRLLPSCRISTHEFWHKQTYDPAE